MRKESRFRNPRRNTLFFKNIARDRIERLLALAEQFTHTDPDVARVYVSIALRIGMKCRVRLPTIWKWRICKGCNTLLCPGLNCTLRTKSKRQHHIVIRCLNCGRVSRRNIK